VYRVLDHIACSTMSASRSRSRRALALALERQRKPQGRATRTKVTRPSVKRGPELEPPKRKTAWAANGRRGAKQMAIPHWDKEKGQGPQSTTMRITSDPIVGLNYEL
jgi:hypothetical protein